MEKPWPSMYIPIPRLRSTTEALSAKVWICWNTAALVVAEVNMSGILYFQFTTDTGAACVSTEKAVIMPIESAAPRKA